MKLLQTIRFEFLTLYSIHNMIVFQNLNFYNYLEFLI